MSNKVINTDKPPIDTWQKFTSIVRARGCRLLKCLDHFPNAVLVTGCQRSGTTILARIITQSAGMVNYWVGPDDELDAALILSGDTAPPAPGRYCFQTTYLDECYHEYYEHQGSYQIIWVIRNPYAVVYSLLYNWSSAALDGTFEKCAAQQLTGLDARLYRWFGLRAINRTRRACALYKAKTQQLSDLYANLGPERVLIVEYDDLVLQKDTRLPKIYQYINLEYNSQYSQQIHGKSIDKKSKLSKQEQAEISKTAEPIYEKVCALKNSQDVSQQNAAQHALA